MDSFELGTIIDDYKEPVIVFFVDKETLENKVVYINKTCKNLLNYNGVKGFEKIRMEDFFDFSKEELSWFINDKINRVNMEENRLMHISPPKSGIFNVRYTLLTKEDGLLIQIVFDNFTEEREFNLDLIEVESNIDRVDSKIMNVALLVIKNYDVLLKTYGKEKMKYIQRVIKTELNQRFDSVAVYNVNRAYLICNLNRRENLVADYRESIREINKSLSNGLLKFFCEFKVGVSSSGANRYEMLKEAKFSLTDIYNQYDVSVGQIVPTETSMMTYIIKNDLPYAIEKEELSIALQGIYNIKDSVLYGFEVLIRWTHKKYGVISPALFIPIAEKENLITSLDIWVVEEALQVFEKLDIPNKDKLKMNFNVSAKDLLSSTFVDRFIGLVKDSSLLFENIIVELTETFSLHSQRFQIARLKEKGVMIALDDFGTGFASLSQIKNNEIDFLKIDISFIRDINKNYDNTLITNAILALANSLNIEVIAEGVENDEQVRFLKAKKCKYVQGFKLHKPVDGEKLLNQIQEKELPLLCQVSESTSLELNRYVDTYMYGQFIYLSVDYSGQIVHASDMLTKTIGYDLGSGKKIESIVVYDLSKSFKKHLEEIILSGNHTSFMTELVGFQDSIPVKVVMSLNKEKELIDIYFEDFSDKREDYVKIQNAYNRYDLIFQTVKSAIIVTDTEMSIQEWNDHAAYIFGYAQEEVIGKNLIKLIVPDMLQEVINDIVIETAKGEVTSNVNENVKKDGSTIICQWENSNLVNEQGKVIGFISWIMDITEKVKLEDELRYQSTVVQQESSGVFLMDTKGCVEFVNDAFVNMSGYSSAEAIGQDAGIFFCEEEVERYSQYMWKRIKAGEIWEEQLRSRRKDGSIYLTESRFFSIKNDHDDIIKVCCIQKDVTSDVEKDKKMNQINLVLENQERLSMIGQMAAGIIHEINNPLSYIDINVHALSTMIEGISHPEDNKEIIEELADISEDLKDGISSIKDIAAGLKRFTYKTEGIKFEEIDLNAEIRTIATVSKNEYKYNSVLTFDEGEIPLINGDSGKIKQVLLNLIINASHAIKDKEGGWGEISIRTYEEDGYVCCEITDDGGGIPADIQDKIFESFFTTKAQGLGTGLGLSLSKKIIEEYHKGELSFQTRIGEGTTFIVKLNKTI